MAEAAFRISVDINVWAGWLLARRRGLTQGAIHTVISTVRALKVGNAPLQLVMSLEMLDTLERVLARIGLPLEEAREAVGSIASIMMAGPEHLTPYLLISGRDQLTLHDREDAGVLATAISARVNLLITDNLKDFQTSDGEVINTRILRSKPTERQLFTILHERQDGVSLVVAHPIDAANWLLEGLLITPEAIRARYRQP